MKTLAVVGGLLIALGLVGLIWGGVSYTKNKETANVGPLDITVKEKKRVAIPAPVSVAAVVGGVVLLVVGTRRRTT
jgi:hypothetical protein